MNKYTLRYTIINPSDRSVKAEHKVYAFESELDMLGALDDSMSKLFDKFEADKPTEVFARGIELTNPQEFYEQRLKEEATA